MKKITKKEKTRLKIMHSAKGLFEEYGIENVTFSQIAENAEVCRTTVFNHFSDSKELMLALTTQEITDLEEFCIEKKSKGEEMIYLLFFKLIEDASLYPKLTTTLMNNAILSHDENNPIKNFEFLVVQGLLEQYDEKTAEEIAVLVCGAYYGLINHYHINNTTFDGEQMKAEFKKLVSYIMVK